MSHLKLATRRQLSSLPGLVRVPLGRAEVGVFVHQSNGLPVCNVASLDTRLRLVAMDTHPAGVY